MIVKGRRGRKREEWLVLEKLKLFGDREEGA